MLLVVPPFSCLLSLLFPFSPSLPVIKLLYLTRSLHWWWNLKFEIGVSRLRIGVRLKDLEVVVLVDCLPGASLGAWSVSVKTQKRSLWQENLLSTFSAERGRSASTNPTASFSPSSFTAPKRLRKLQNSGINRRCCLSLHFACIDVSVPVKVIMLSRTKQVVNYFLKKVRFPP